jgi:hypothetical protein
MRNRLHYVGNNFDDHPELAEPSDQSDEETTLAQIPNCYDSMIGPADVMALKSSSGNDVRSFLQSALRALFSPRAFRPAQIVIHSTPTGRQYLMGLSSA